MRENYLKLVLEMLGNPLRRYADPEAWHRLENDLGVILPADYKEIVDAYAPVDINGHLSLYHPATDRWNLGEEIRDMSDAWSEIEWGEDEIEGDPRLSLGVSELLFGTPDGLIPLASTDRREVIFYAPRGASGKGALFIEGGTYEFFEFSFSFAEWLYRWLIGEEVTGPGGSAFYPGPVALRDLPMSSGERPETRYGPPRGM
ncbi:SMI1/KNR4 family protein [Streptomyces niveiscabiei]|uniref:SMI1/KNR4 family protein n=1 Tax=Streptomyces niveiscabiei TaxID=164115 RepID=UPI0029BA7D5D|nr:SMI1/KNR4 family protein [Streptomyces niveiscabiei]MDX3386471.1 SMI1/KNR4 family protein [Streptomyces niveiscabiei]